MFEVLTAEEMRRADDNAQSSGHKGIDLIRTAGRGVTAHMAECLEPSSVLVLCGKGHNGADGFIVAAELMARGWPVRLACLAKPGDLKGDIALAAKSFTGKIELLNSNLGLKDTQVIVDAVFGTGFRGTLEPELITLFDKIRTKKLPVVAVDIPSGIDATTGEITEGTLASSLTVTFCRRKVAHLLYPARALCGRIVKCDVGISDDAVNSSSPQAFENHPSLWLGSFPLPDHASHKYTRGHIGVYAGSHRTGAAALSALAAQRSGAGAVTVMAPPDTRDIYRSLCASLMVDIWPETDAYKAIIADARKSAFVIGPGALPAMGGEEDLRAHTLATLATQKAVVLDGDIFRAFEHQPQALFSQLSPDRHVLTPHGGEFTRLFGSPDGSKLEQARYAAKKANAIIVYKGADTVIAAPEGLAVIDVSGPPTLATAGSGDVLAGLIAGFASQGMPPFFAACAAVWLHAQAARLQGTGLIAEDIISHIPQALNDLFTGKSLNL